MEDKQRRAEDLERLEGKKKDAIESDKQMTGKAEAETEDQKQAKKVVGKAAKMQREEQENREHDEKLYRPHG